MLTEEQKQKLRVAGYSESKIAAYEQVKSGKPDGFISGVKSAWKSSVADTQAVRNSKQSGASKVLQTVGNAAGFVGDIGLEAVKAVTPNKVEDVVSGGIKKVAQTKPVQDVLGKYNQWAQAHPEASKNLQAVVDIASIIPAGKGVQIAGKVAAKGAQKTATAVTSAGKGVAKGIGSATESVLKPANIMQRVARIPKQAQAKFKEMAGEDVGEYLSKRGMFDNIEQQLFERFSASKATADEALASLKGNFSPTPVKTALSELKKREVRVSSPGALSPDLKRVMELSNKLDSGGLNMSEINEVKRLFERNVRLDFVKQNLPEGVARSTNIDNALRQWQSTQAEKLGLKDLPKINRETRLARQLLDALGKENAGSLGNNAFSLTDAILVAGGDPASISMLLTKKALSSKKLRGAVAKKLYKGENIGMPKATFGAPKPGLEEFLKRN